MITLQRFLRAFILSLAVFGGLFFGGEVFASESPLHAKFCQKYTLSNLGLFDSAPQCVFSDNVCTCTHSSGDADGFETRYSVSAEGLLSEIVYIDKSLSPGQKIVVRFNEEGQVVDFRYGLPSSHSSYIDLVGDSSTVTIYGKDGASVDYPVTGSFSFKTTRQISTRRGVRDDANTYTYTFGSDGVRSSFDPVMFSDSFYDLHGLSFDISVINDGKSYSILEGSDSSGLSFFEGFVDPNFCSSLESSSFPECTFRPFEDGEKCVCSSNPSALIDSVTYVRKKGLLSSLYFSDNGCSQGDSSCNYFSYSFSDGSLSSSSFRVLSNDGKTIYSGDNSNVTLLDVATNKSTFGSLIGGIELISAVDGPFSSGRGSSGSNSRGYLAKMDRGVISSDVFSLDSDFQGITSFGAVYSVDLGGYVIPFYSDGFGLNPAASSFVDLSDFISSSFSESFSFSDFFTEGAQDYSVYNTSPSCNYVPDSRNRVDFNCSVGSMSDDFYDCECVYEPSGRTSGSDELKISLRQSRWLPFAFEDIIFTGNAYGEYSSQDSVQPFSLKLNVPEVSLTGKLPCSDGDSCPVECNSDSCFVYSNLPLSLNSGELINISYRDVKSNSIKGFVARLIDGKLSLEYEPLYPLKNIRQFGLKMQLVSDLIDRLSDFFNGEIMSSIRGEGFDFLRINRSDFYVNIYPGEGGEIERVDTEAFKDLRAEREDFGQVTMSKWGLNVTNIQPSQGGGYSIVLFVNRIIDVVVYLSGALTVFFIVWGSLTLIVSGNDSDKVSQAKNMIFGSLMALLIIYSSYILVRLLVDIIYFNI